MSYQLYNINDATTEPVTLAELKSQLRITSSDQDTMLGSIILAARQKAEEFTKRFLRVGATEKAAIYRMFLDKFPDDGNREIKIYQCPVTVISSIYYYNASGVLTLLDTDYYDSDIISEPARIQEAYGYSWPTIQDRINAIYIEFQSGYKLATSVPPEIKQGILMIAAHLYENPSDIVTGTQVNTIPKASEWLLNDFRLNRI